CRKTAERRGTPNCNTMISYRFVKQFAIGDCRTKSGRLLNARRFIVAIRPQPHLNSRQLFRSDKTNLRMEAKMKRTLFSVLVSVLVFVFTSGDVWAQATAQISGTVRDQSGAVLPGVEVVATQTDTGIARTAVTNETGSYVLTNLPIGPYRLEAGLPGFRTYAQTGIVLQVNASAVINPVLEVGQISEQVEVQANAALVETRSVGIGQVVENARILELPL